MEDAKEILETMKRLAVEAGEEILKFYSGDIDVTYKADDSPVTKADKAANELIVGGLAAAYPDIAILAEESVDNPARLKNRYCFVVDPLDGTREFLKKNGEFTVNIALCEDGRPLSGVIYVPVLHELYYAWKGMGAYASMEGISKRLSVSSRIGGVRLARSRTHHAEELDRLIEKNAISEIIIAGSSYKGCLLARGDVEAYYRFGRTMEWDTAAMEAIVLEAGGIFRGMDGQVMAYNKVNPENPTGFYLLNHPQNALVF